jgi:hypothetical protein
VWGGIGKIENPDLKKQKYKQINFDFGPLWSVLNLNYEYRKVFWNLSNMTTLTDATLKLKPDFILL